MVFFVRQYEGVVPFSLPSLLLLAKPDRQSYQNKINLIQEASSFVNHASNGKFTNDTIRLQR